MRRNKKGSLELGVNSIVILIIAMAVLGLIIYFIYKNLQPEIPPLPTQPAAAPDSGNTITTSPPELAGKSGEKISARLNVFNPDSVNNQTIKSITLTCTNSGSTPVSGEIKINAQTIGPLNYGEFIGVITFPRAAKDKYLCQFKAFNDADPAVQVTSKDVVIEIK